MDPLIGVSFGPYAVVEKLGEGRLGTTYRGYQEALNRYIAIKVFRSELSRNPAFLEQLRHQILAAARLSHPSILHIYSAGLAHGVCYVVMDLALGGSLRAHGQGRAVDAMAAARITGQLADALGYAHDAGVFHGDVQTDSILMTRDGRPLLADFGIAPAVEAMQRSAQPHEGASRGMSAERAASKASRSQADIRALGAVLFELLTGQVPAWDSGQGTSNGGRTDRVPNAKLLDDSQAPAWLTAVAKKALSDDPDERYQHARDMARDLEWPGSQPRHPKRVGKREGGHRRLTMSRRLVVGLSLGIAAVAIALVVGAVILFGEGDQVGAATGLPPSSPSAPAAPGQTSIVSIPTPLATPTASPVAQPSAQATAVPSATTARPRPSATLAPTGVATDGVATVTSAAPATTTASPVDTADAAPTVTQERSSPTPPGAARGRIAFSAYDEIIGGYRLFVFVLADGRLQAIAEFAHQPEFRSDGRRLVVDGLGGGREDLWSLRADGSDWQQMTRHPDDQFPTWTPDGGGIAFSSTRQGDGVFRLYVNDELVRTGVTHQVTADYPVMLPNWEIVFSGCNYGWGDGSKCGLWRVKNGGTPAQLTENPQDIPTDGTASEVVFLRSSAGNWDVYRVAREGGGTTRLTSHPGRDGPAAFSPDGNMIAFLSDRGGAWALYTMDRDGGNLLLQLELPHGGALDSGPGPWHRERISWSW